MKPFDAVCMGLSLLTGFAAFSAIHFGNTIDTAFFSLMSAAFLSAGLAEW